MEKFLRFTLWCLDTFSDRHKKVKEIIELKKILSARKIPKIFNFISGFYRGGTEKK